MKLLIILTLTLATCFALPSPEIKSRNILVPGGQPEGRITKGRNASLGQFPYQVRLTILLPDDYETKCGGSIIGNEWILTAAHCTEGAIGAIVLLGATWVRYYEVEHKVTVKNIIMHPKYNNRPQENDISLIKIPYTNFTEKIQPIKLPAKGTSYASYDGDNVIASGWGKTSDVSRKIPRRLQWAQLKVISNKVCNKSSRIYSSNICTSTVGGVNTCVGDSGGPLVLESSKVQIGITSSGHRLCMKSDPAVYTRTTSFLEWIKGHTGVFY